MWANARGCAVFIFVFFSLFVFVFVFVRYKVWTNGRRYVGSVQEKTGEATQTYHRWLLQPRPMLKINIV